MAENGNRGPNDFRARNGKRRREPPIIDASATEVPLDPETPDAVTADAAPLPAAVQESHSADPSAEVAPSPETAEPVLFGSAMREPAAKAAATADPADPSAEAVGPAPSAADEAVPPSAAGGAVPPSAATPVASAEEPRVAPAPSPGPGGGSVPPYAMAPERAGGGALPWLLGLSSIALLAALAWVIYTEPQRSGRAEIADLRNKVAALEARPDPAQVQGSVAALDKRFGAADAERATLARTVAGLTTRLDAVSQQAQAAQADSARPAVQPTPAPSGAAAAATVGALGALAAKLDGVDGRLAALATAQGQTAKAVADLPKPVAPDFGPVNARVAALDGQLAALDGKVNGSDARLNGFDAKVNAVDGKINGFDARMNAFENRTNGIEAKGNDAASGLGRLQATVSGLPRVDLAPLQSATAALDGRVVKVEGQLAASKDGARVTEARAVGSADETRATPIALVGQAVVRAVADGRPYAADLDALKALGADPEAVARMSPLAAKGAPTAAALRDRWEALQGEVLAAVKPAEAGSALDRFTASARALVQVRRVGAVQGDDPAALVSQVEAALTAGDVPGALAAWDRLPQAGKDRSQDWAAAARGRVDAAAAAQGLVGRAIAALGKTKS